MKRTKRAVVHALKWVVCTLMLSSVSTMVTAGSNEAKVTVTATILKRASLEVLTQPPSITVTAADIARGYVDVPTPAQVAIRSNSAVGYMLEFASQGDFMRHILVTGLGNDVQLSPAGGAVRQPYSGPGITNTTLALAFRFVLSESAQQGSYAWPMHISVTPL